jgi:hypothetical protein
MTSKKATLWRRLAVAVAIFMSGYLTAKFFSGPAIPTCESCTLTIDPSRSTTATGKMTSMPKSYVRAEIVVNPGSSSESTTVVKLPTVSQNFTYANTDTPNPLPVFQSKAQNAVLRLSYKYGGVLYHGPEDDLRMSCP